MEIPDPAEKVVDFFCQFSFYFSGTMRIPDPVEKVVDFQFSFYSDFFRSIPDFPPLFSDLLSLA